MKIKNNNRKLYQKPAMQVFHLQARLTILAGSDGLGDRSPYTPEDTDPFNP